MNYKALKGKMVSNGFTQEQIAKIIGISRTSLSRKMNGITSFTLDEVDKLCDVLSISNDSEKAYIFLS